MPQITINNRQLEVKELLVSDIYKWLESRKALEAADGFDLIDHCLLTGAALSDLLYMTDLDRDAQQDMTPTNLQKVLEKCKEVNPHFFLLRERAGLAQQ